MPFTAAERASSSVVSSTQSKAATLRWRKSRSVYAAGEPRRPKSLTLAVVRSEATFISLFFLERALALLQERFIDVAPHPPLFDRLHERVVCGTKVPRRVPILGVVTTPHVAAGKTLPEMNPIVSPEEALRANLLRDIGQGHH